MWYDVHVENLLNIKGKSRNLTAMGLRGKKNNFLREYSRYHHKNRDEQDNFCSLQTWKWTTLVPVLRSQLLLISTKVGCAFVPKFYNEKRASNFLKHLTYVGEPGPDSTTCKYTEIGRKYYEYKKSTDYSAKSILSTDSNWPFPDTYYKSIGSTVRGFSFYFPNLSDSLRNLIQPSPN